MTEGHGMHPATSVRSGEPPRHASAFPHLPHGHSQPRRSSRISTTNQRASFAQGSPSPTPTISAFDLTWRTDAGASASGSTSTVRRTRHRLRNSKYLASYVPPAVLADIGTPTVHYHSFRAPSERAPARRALLTDRGDRNVAAVFQLEADDPIQLHEDRSAYARNAWVARQKITAAAGAGVCDAHALDRDRRPARLQGCDWAAARVTRREASWVENFTPYARPYDVEPPVGRCGHKKHYCTTFERVQAVPTSAMYLSETERFPL